MSDLDTRCFKCNCIEYASARGGEHGVSGFICASCIQVLEGRKGLIESLQDEVKRLKEREAQLLQIIVSNVEQDARC